MKKSDLKKLGEDIQSALDKAPEARTQDEVALAQKFESKQTQLTEALEKFADKIQAANPLANRLAELKNPPQRTPLQTHLGQSAVHKIAEAQREAYREKEEQREREKQMLVVLEQIHEELLEERRERQRLAEKVQEHADELVRLRTGAPGRPGSSHLALEELRRRIAADELEESLREQARVLEAWLRHEHPQAHPVTARTIENKIRAEYRRLKRRRGKRTPKTR